MVQLIFMVSPSLKKLFLLTQKAHFKSSNIPRLEGAIKVYAALSRSLELRTDILKKLTAMLLHPYPKVETFQLLNYKR